VDVIGTAEVGVGVEVFTVERCQGTPAVKAFADAAGEFRARVPLAPNQITSVSARAVDDVGNHSECAADTLRIAHDDVPPPAPEVTGVEPGPLSNIVVTPRIAGTAAAGSLVVLYEGGGCDIALPYSGLADAAGRFRVEARVDRDSETVFHARAFDEAGNPSPCSAQAVSFIHDGTAPPAPTVETAIGSPSPEASPLLVSSAEPGATVRVFAGRHCDGTLAAEGISNAQGSFAVHVDAARNAENFWSASATDPAGNVSDCGAALAYVHDDLPPTGTIETAWSPPSPAPERSPFLVGIVSGDRGVAIELSRDGIFCVDPETMRVPLDIDGKFVARLQAPPNAFMSVGGRLVDAAGNRSPCKPLGIYRHDDIPPPPPTVVTASVPNPNRDETTITVAGSGEVFARIHLWSDPACTQPLPGQGTVESDFPLGDNVWYAVPTVVPTGVATAIYANATDQAGNQSTCSLEPLVFTHRDTASWGHRTAGRADAVGDDGTAYRLRRRPAPGQELLLQRAPANGTWGPEESVYVGAAGMPQVVPLSGGDVVVMWDVEGASPMTRVRRSDGVWQDAEPILPATGASTLALKAISDRVGRPARASTGGSVDGPDSVSRCMVTRAA